MARGQVKGEPAVLATVYCTMRHKSEPIIPSAKKLTI